MNKDIKTLSYIYSVRIYTAVITIVLIPALIAQIGIEAYGLIGFFTVLQACLSILDAGVGGVLTRESIISKNSLSGFTRFNVLYKKVVFFFIILALVLSFVGWLICQRYSMSWLNTSLASETVITCTTLMFWIFSLRYIQGPFRSIILSNESQLTLTTINFISITLSQPITLLFLKIYNGDIVFYFIIQLIVAFISSGIIIACGERIRKKILTECKEKNNDERCVDNKTSFKNLFLFALQLSTLSILWILVNQSDKLALTKYISLSQYGIYSVAVSVISILAIFSDPLNQFLQPRLTKFYHERQFDSYLIMFLNAFRFICILTIPLSAFLIFYSEEIVFIWSNDFYLATQVAKYLPWLFIGGVFAAYSNFIFLLLYSFGNLKKHTLVYTIFSLIVIPANIYIAKTYFGEGTSIFFAVSSIILFATWGGYNFMRAFSDGIKLLIIYILPLFVIEIAYFKLTEAINFNTENRLLLFLVLAILGVIGVGIALIYHWFINRVNPATSYRLIRK
ncbi:oligosaccharide flippase family protein [Citrobacter sedlakii]|uniref:lipopolysaccharide biosynthesis protein n=1 Tax=Citrobacter sedlakii TaxID=67826 RepID=UPI0022B38510|nr:oligosaccharide flippase family protein [Citrobacter sedlakii]MCZ4673871.1 oligosaccharide flippase family protein [Citrobacter sedlakii]MDR5003927.1 oligosaccharide flippase family protein [Citrobacter sedlakii]